MRRYTDLEQSELAVLEEPDVEKLIELEIAEAGILPVPCPASPNLASVGISKSDIAFEVGGVVVRTEEEALRIASMEVLKEDYDYNIGYSYKWLKPHTRLEVEKVAFYRQDDVVRVSAALVDLERKKNAYEEERKVYDAFVKETGKHRNEVWGTVDEARKAVAEIKFANEVYVKHLELADGDEVVARRFFTNAYEDRTDIVEAVVGAGVTGSA